MFALLRDIPSSVGDDAVPAAGWSLDISQEMRLKILDPYLLIRTVGERGLKNQED